MNSKKFMCYTIKPFKKKDGSYELTKSYYQGFVDLKMFGLSPVLGRQEDAKKFDSREELVKELQEVRTDITDYSIEEVD